MTDQELTQAADEAHGLRDDLERARNIAAALEQENDEALRLLREAMTELAVGRVYSARAACEQAEKVLAGETE